MRTSWTSIYFCFTPTIQSTLHLSILYSIQKKLESEHEPGWKCTSPQQDRVFHNIIAEAIFLYLLCFFGAGVYV